VDTHFEIAVVGHLNCHESCLQKSQKRSCSQRSKGGMQLLITYVRFSEKKRIYFFSSTTYSNEYICHKECYIL